MYPTNAHSLLCKTLHRFGNMFRSRGIIIRAPHTLNIGMLLYTIHIRSYTVCGYVISVLCVLSIWFYRCIILVPHVCPGWITSHDACFCLVGCDHFLGRTQYYYHTYIHAWIFSSPRSWYSLSHKHINKFEFRGMIFSLT
jgi:hypothetical protein